MTPAALTPLVPSTVVGLGGPHPLRVLRAHLNTLYLLRHQIRQASELRKQLVSLRKSFVDANTCAICTELLGDPHTLECGHSFCQGCLQTWFQTKKECPTCREQIFRRPTPAFSLAHQVELVGTLTALDLPPDEDDLVPDLDRLFGDVVQIRHLEQLVARGTVYRSDCKRLHTAVKAKARAYLLTTNNGTQRSARAVPTGSTSSSRAVQSGTRSTRQWDQFFPSRVSPAVLRNRTLLVVCGQCSMVMDRPTCLHCQSQLQLSPPTSSPEAARSAELPRLPAYYLPAPAPTPAAGTDSTARSATPRTRTTTRSTRPSAQNSHQQTQPATVATSNTTTSTPSATSVPFLELQWVTSEDDGEYSNPQATPVPLYTPPPPTQGARTQPAANATQRGDTRSTARSTTSSTRPSAQNNRQQTQSVPTTTSNTTTNMPSAISVPYFELQWGGSEDDDDEYSNPQVTPIPLYTPPSPTQSARTQPAQTDNHPAEPATNSDQGGITHSTARSIYHAIDPDWDFDGIANDLGDMTEAERADLEEYIFYSDPRHAMYRYDPSQFEHFDDGDSFDDDLDIPYY